MKKKLIYLGLTGCILFALCTRLQAQIDSLQAHRYVTRATMYGIGFTNLIYNFIAILDFRFCAIIRHGVGQTSNFFAYTADLQAGCLSIGAEILFNLGLDLMQ